MAEQNEDDGAEAQRDDPRASISAGDAEERLPWNKVFRQAFERAQRQSRSADRRGLGRDRSGSLLVLAAGAVVALLLFFLLFSSPNREGRFAGARARRAPALGKRPARGSETGSTTPLLSAQAAPWQPQDRGQITARDVNETARPIAAVPTAKGRKASYALGRIDLSDLDARRRMSSQAAKRDSDDLRKPSLVFVQSAQRSPELNASRVDTQMQPSLVELGLPAGTRLLARMESAATTAIRAPVVAVVEYNYERDGEIVVPAGARAVGSIVQADGSGNVSIRFHSLQLPDGTTEKIEAAGMSLTYGPLKGVVGGRKTGTNFLIRSFTGLGQAAAYLLGSGSLGAPLSEGALLRERIAANIGVAGDQELDRLSFHQTIVVTVPANTRFYIVVDQGTAAAQPAPGLAQRVNPRSPPSIEELRELLELRRELGAMLPESASGASSPQELSPE